MSLENFHLRVEAFCDAVVAGEAPHGGNFLRPVVERVAEGSELSKAAGLQIGNGLEEMRNDAGALATRSVLYSNILTSCSLKRQTVLSAGCWSK